MGKSPKSPVERALNMTVSRVLKYKMLISPTPLFVEVCRVLGLTLWNDKSLPLHLHGTSQLTQTVAMLHAF